MSIHKKLYGLPDEIKLPEGFTIRKTRKKDSKALRDIINKYLSKFNIRTHYTKKEVEHWFTHVDGKIIHYVFIMIKIIHKCRIKYLILSQLIACHNYNLISK